MTARAYLESLPFLADDFQRRAADAIDRGASVVVAAPTGAGKTVVAEAAMARAFERDLRAVYTTPLKALSNQKYGDFRLAHGDEAVGLLTGDNSINGNASLVVMTTEVLRNMMYLGSPDLDDIGVVVLDEVHYLQDRSRGSVWEEIIIHLDPAIPLVCLSATIANAEEFADWVGSRRGETELIEERERPVPLESTYLARDRWAKGDALRLLPVFHRGAPNERVTKMLRASGRGGRRYATPRRHETAEFLAGKGLLPAIYFIFSRKGCDDAVGQVVSRGLRLTTDAEADRISQVAEANTRGLSPADLDVLGFSSWLNGLRRGVAPHHAGLVPAMKETVEELFSAGLVKLVFATETLALGINMPARTVVLSSLSKFTGEGHEMLLPGDYTQLTGRAGRRGIDQEGTAVILHSPYVSFERAAGIAGAGSHPLRSSFGATYNMVVNLVARYPRSETEALLKASFAEYGHQRAREAILGDIAEDEARLTDLRMRAEHPDIDIWELLDSTGEGRGREARPGDVFQWQEKGRTVRYAVTTKGTGRRPRLLAVSDGAALRRIAPERLPGIRKVGSIEMPRPLRPRDPAFRKRVARLLRGLPDSAPEEADDDGLAEHLAAARAVRRLEAAIGANRARLEASSGVVATFEAVLGVLEHFGYANDWDLTIKGERLRRIYAELDLIVAETVHRGWLHGLDGPEIAAAVAAFTYEARNDDPPPPWPRRIAELGKLIDAAWGDVAAVEQSRGLQVSRQPDPGFSELAARWVEGASLHELFSDDEPGLAVGDFVRNCRQALDLLRQIRAVEEYPPPGVAAALRGMDRGVVAAAGAL